MTALLALISANPLLSLLITLVGSPLLMAALKKFGPMLLALLPKGESKLDEAIDRTSLVQAHPFLGSATTVLLHHVDLAFTNIGQIALDDALKSGTLDAATGAKILADVMTYFKGYFNLSLLATAAQELGISANGQGAVENYIKATVQAKINTAVKAAPNSNQTDPVENGAPSDKTATQTPSGRTLIKPA